LFVYKLRMKVQEAFLITSAVDKSAGQFP